MYFADHRDFFFLSFDPYGRVPRAALRFTEGTARGRDKNSICGRPKQALQGGEK